jgi:serine/threonine protein kinase
MSNLSEKYSIIKPLGAQSKRKFGAVYLVQNKLTLEFAVLKSLVKTEINFQLQARLLKEATFSFNTLGLPQTIDFFESESEIIVLKNYSEGMSLDEYWKTIKSRKRIQVFQVILPKLIYLLQILAEQKIVHCDLKPSNIIVHEENGQIEVTLIDFGMALRTDEENQRQTLFPLGYAAPELLLNKLEIIDQRTDQFSLGIIIWKLFTDKLPLSHPNPSVFTNLQLTHPLPDHVELPKGYYPILLKMCNKHQFKTAPNLISQEEILNRLSEGINGRFNNYDEILLSFQAIPIRRNIFGF